MCKLFAYVNTAKNARLPLTASNKINKALQHLFYINSYGQIDGSGLMWMEDDGDTGYIKEAISASIFTQTRTFASVKSSLSDSRFVAGHTRYSTVGANSWDNSHPFEFDRYLGMQNGTIKNNHRTLVPGKSSPCEVDSESVFWSFEKQGIDKTFDQYRGEGVFMFFDKEESTFNIVKNNKRTLFIAELTETDGYIIATEADAIKLVCNRADLGIEEPKPVINNKLITYHLTGGVSFSDLEVKVPEPIVYSHTYGDKKPTNNDQRPTTTPSNRLPATLDNDPDPDPLLMEYVDDCVSCGNPIILSDSFSGDGATLGTSTHFCCNTCTDAYEAWSGKIMYDIGLPKGDIRCQITQ